MGDSFALSGICPGSSFGGGGRFAGLYNWGVELLDQVWMYYKGGSIGCGGAEGLGNAGAYGSGV